MNYLYQNLEQELSEQIMRGQLPSGTKLPSIRSLCQRRGLSKATVIHAYQRLEAAGLIEARFKSGFYVCNRETQRLAPTDPDVKSEPQLVDMSDLMRDIMERSAAFDIYPQEEGYQSLPTGIVELNRSIGRALRRQKGAGHQYYDEPAGLSSLRDQIAERYSRMGCSVSASDITMTAGCQHGLSLALQMCCQPGDIVAVESPGFYGVLQLIESMGLKVLEIPVSAKEGMSVVALKQALESWEIKACVVTPSFATPTGALMPKWAREALLKMAIEKDFMLIEDDIYGDLAFAARVPPLKQMDHDNRVVLCGSFSKSLSRDLRLGWVISSDQQQLKRLKMVNLLALSKFTQQGLVDYIVDGSYEKHIRKQRSVLQTQCNQLIDLLDEEWSEIGPLRVSQPQGGLALWVELDPGYNLTSCYLKARSEGIVMTPGNLFTAQERYSNCLRISFAHHWNDKRIEALKRLAAIIKAYH